MAADHGAGTGGPEQATDGGDKKGDFWPRSRFGAVLALLGGIALAVGMLDAQVLGDFSPVQQVRAQRFGSTGTITAWDCHADWYEGKGSRTEVLACQGTFHGDDGVTIDRVNVYHPDAEDLDQNYIYWVVGPDAEWAFSYVEWELVVLVVFTMPFFLGLAGWMVYAGVRRLVVGRPRPGPGTG